MNIDVIIPVYSPKEDFYEALRRLCSQSVLPKRIILMNTEAKEADTELLRDKVSGVEGADKVEFVINGIAKKDFDHGGTRKAALKYSDSELVLYMTQDALPKNDKLIENLMKGFVNERVAAAYARQLPHEVAKETEKLARSFNYPENSSVKTAADVERLGIKTYFCSNACAAYRRSVLDELNGFDEGTLFAEDMLFAFKAINAGYAIAYRAEARVIHSHNYTYREQFRRNYQMAVAQAEHPEVYNSVSSEKEGFKYVGFATKQLLKKGKIAGVLDFYIESAFKYAGFFCGKHFGRKRM